jgi:hypothetical protein
VTRRTKQIGVFLALAAMISFGAWPFWKYLYLRSASAAVQERTKALVDGDVHLRAAWTIAMQDGVLSEAEAAAIFEQAGATLPPEK